MTEFSDILKAKGKEAGFVFSALQLEQFSFYYEKLLLTNKVMNLTTITEPEEVAVKHMIDSLLVFEDCFTGKKLADVGTGAGFPGLPLKIYCPSLEVTLIDSLAKRLNFLQELIDEMQLKNISVKHLRAEDAGQKTEHREHYDIVVARAVAALPVLAEYCLPLTKKNGYFYAMKGAKYKEEVAVSDKALAVLGGALVSAQEVKLPGITDVRAIIKIFKEKNTPQKYPRKAGVVAKNPL